LIQKHSEEIFSAIDEEYVGGAVAIEVCCYSCDRGAANAVILRSLKGSVSIPQHQRHPYNSAARVDVGAGMRKGNIEMTIQIKVRRQQATRAGYAGVVRGQYCRRVESAVAVSKPYLSICVHLV
jgi:hypothetical protein